MFSKTKTAIHFNLLQISPPAPSFRFAVLFKPSFNVLSGSFRVSLNLVAAVCSHFLNSNEFCDTGLRKSLDGTFTTVKFLRSVICASYL